MTKFNVGDKVRILDVASLESENVPKNLRGYFVEDGTYNYPYHAEILSDSNAKYSEAKY